MRGDRTMEEIIGKLRWLPLGPTCGPAVPIKKSDLDKIAGKFKVDISLEEVKGKNMKVEGDMIREDTMESTLEEITQTVVTVSARDEGAFRNAVQALIKKYYAPRTTQSFWGSTDKGKLIIAELLDEYDGWT
jgi:hypothetical protein